MHASPQLPREQGDDPMHSAPVSASVSSEHYWTTRAVETETELSRTSREDLRLVYSELITHYRKMASLYGMLSDFVERETRAAA